MSSVMKTSLAHLNGLLTSTKSVLESSDYFNTALGFTLSSYTFAKEHKAEIVGAGVASFVAWYLAKIWYAQRTFKRMGIKTPDYKFLTGNFKEIAEKSYSEALREWTVKYGKIYGIYEGHTPILITSDADMVQEVYIKQFSNFSARRYFSFSFDEEDPRVSLFFASKGRWRRHRNIINPTFTTSKLKELYGFIRLCSDRFIEEIDQHTGKSIVALTYLRRYTMDVIWNCAFGVDIDCQRHPDNKFFLKGVEIFDAGADVRWNLLLAIYFPEYRTLFFSISFLITMIFEKFTQSKLVNDPASWLVRNIGQTFEKRFALKAQRKDFVNILLETHNEQYNKDQDHKNSKEFETAALEKKMTLDEIKNNMIGFLLAGFETTSSTLNFCFYIMAKHPEELKKLQAEVDSHFKDALIDYDNINNLEYLDMFIKEVLRHYPLANNVIGRRCTNACTVNGIDIPEDLTIAVDCKTLHFDPEHWGADAQEFNPLRFAPDIKRHPAVYMPFGLGPRTCVGMRFALLEVKLTLAKFLLKYDVVATPETPKELKYTETGGVMLMRTPIVVAINPRK